MFTVCYRYSCNCPYRYLQYANPSCIEDEHSYGRLTWLSNIEAQYTLSMACHTCMHARVQFRSGSAKLKLNISRALFSRHKICADYDKWPDGTLAKMQMPSYGSQGWCYNDEMTVRALFREQDDGEFHTPGA